MKITVFITLSLFLFNFAICDSGKSAKEMELEQREKELAKKEQAMTLGDQDSQPDDSGTSESSESKPKTSEESGDKPSRENAIKSIYTDLTEEKCKEIEGEGAGYLAECPGVGGYSLEFAEHDARANLAVKTPSGKLRNLDLQSLKGGGMTSLGKKAEWRVKKSNGKTTPIGLIFRYEVYTNPGKSDKVRSYLIAAKLDGDTVCATDIIDPVKNANVKARAAADKANSNPCIK